MKHIREEAARWFARMRDAEVDDPERGRFETWLASNPAHAREYAAFEDFWRRLDNAKNWDSIDQGMDRERGQRRRLLKRGAGVVLLAGLAGKAVWWQWRSAAVWKIALDSHIGQARRSVLDDGSQLTLGAASAAEVIYTRAGRRVLLKQGEVAFEVVCDGDRPFVVDAGDVRVTVLGTRFAVTRLTDRTRISVDRGRVEVETGPFWRHQRLLLQDGEVAELRKPGAEAGQLTRIEYAAAGAFVFENGFIDFQNAGLAEIAATFSRYRKAPVVLAGTATRDSRITASINVTDVDGFLQLLPKMAAVEVRFEPDGRAVLQRR